MIRALAWFKDHGTQRVKFTGGEPMAHRGLFSLIAACRSLSMEPTVITNGTVMLPGAMDALAKYGVRMKVSLHGPRERHDGLQGAAVYETVVTTIRSLVAKGIETSVHTLVYRDVDLDLRRWIEFLAREGVHKVSIMSFVPRGRGAALRDEWGLTHEHSMQLSADIDSLANEFAGKIIVRHLDFVNTPYLVFETDGRTIWEVAEESEDRIYAGSVDRETPSLLARTTSRHRADE